MKAKEIVKNESDTWTNLFLSTINEKVINFMNIFQDHPLNIKTFPSGSIPSRTRTREKKFLSKKKKNFVVRNILNNRWRQWWSCAQQRSMCERKVGEKERKKLQNFINKIDHLKCHLMIDSLSLRGVRKFGMKIICLFIWRWNCNWNFVVVKNCRWVTH